MVMRKIQMVMTSVLLAGISLQGFAQESDKKNEERERQQNLNREMTLEREYDPIVQDATKVTTLPAIREMNIAKRPITYSDYAIPMLPEKEMNLLSPGKMMTEVLHSKRNGYLHFGGGMSTNLMGDFGYHLMDNDRNLLGIWVSHRSTNGNVEFEEEGFDKQKAKINDNLGGLDFKHNFDKATFSLGGKFGYSAFNYYGIPTNMIGEYNPLSSAVYPYNPDITTNQGNRLINVYSSVTSHFPFSLGYHFGAEYTNFNQKYSLSKELDGMTENHIAVDFGLSSPVNDGKSFGVDVKANILTYTAPSPVDVVFIDSAAFKAHVNATLNPYYRFERDTWKLLLGVNLMLVSQNDETNFYASPNITLDIPFAVWSLFYANLGGGIESNSMAELSRTNRYVNPVFTADASKTWADLKLGVRSTATAGFWFDIFAGYKYTESDVFFNPSFYGWVYDGFNNVSMIFQPTTQRIQASATLKYDYKHIVDFYLKGVYDYYLLKNQDTWKNFLTYIKINDDSELKPYGKPAFTANAGINVRPVKPLTFTLDYCMMSGIYAHFRERNYDSGFGPIIFSASGNEGDVKMKAINDLRFRTSWKFNDTFSIYAQFNNLLFQKQSLYYGYSLQPFTVMGGFNINF